MSKPLKPINNNLESVTLQDIENHKIISVKELKKDLDKLKKFSADTNANNFYGNPFLYHFQFKNLLKCRREDSKKNIYDIYADPQQWAKLLDNTRFRNRGGRTAAGNIYECFRINLGSIVMFKSTTAKYLYKKYNATNVLDPTAGWGGRMLGAWALDINYTGIDTNIEMKSAYDGMIDFLQTEANIFGNGLLVESNQSKLNMLWDSCLDVDFSNIEYDFVLTSPPYINLEMYEHMELWQSEADFYKNFFIPLWDKSCKHLQPNGHVCFNISPRMYEEAVKYGLPLSDMEEDLLQQLGQQKKKKKQDKIYIWKYKKPAKSRKGKVS
jgi:hypothetical protein